MIDAARLPIASHLVLPITPYRADGYGFGERVRSCVWLWARHLGEDVTAAPGTSVSAIGSGRVVWAQVRAGSVERPNWGGIVIIGHRHKDDHQPFYSLYGHITDLQVREDDEIVVGARLGVVAAGQTPENGWWKTPHLHFAVYVGPWADGVLPGYARPFQGRTKFKWWHSPRQFIADYGAAAKPA